MCKIYFNLLGTVRLRSKPSKISCESWGASNKKESGLYEDHFVLISYFLILFWIFDLKWPWMSCKRTFFCKTLMPYFFLLFGNSTINFLPCFESYFKNDGRFLYLIIIDWLKQSPYLSSYFDELHNLCRIHLTILKKRISNSASHDSPTALQASLPSSLWQTTHWLPAISLYQVKSLQFSETFFEKKNH